jgi:two-component system, OmpR family, response regulator QseB
MKILIIEDDDRISLPIKQDFERQHNSVTLAFDGEEGLRLGLDDSYDLILLDLMLPKIDGMTVCQRLRRAGSKAAIVMITARNNTANKILGLDCGADDYLAKPFELEELAAHIRAVMRRGNESRQPVLTFGDLSVDLNTCVTSYRDIVIELTPTEFRLLAHFLSNPLRTFSKDELVERLWCDDAASENVIKNHIKGLRGKLASAGAPRDIVETVYGIGYRLKHNA